MTGILAYSLMSIHRENCFEEAGLIRRYAANKWDTINFYYIRTAFGYLPVCADNLQTYIAVETPYIIDRDFLRVKANFDEEDSLEIILDDDRNIIRQSGLLCGIKAKSTFGHPITFVGSFTWLSGANSATPFERLEKHEKPLFYTDPTSMLTTLSVDDDGSEVMPFVNLYLESVRKDEINSRIETDSERSGMPTIGKLYYPTFLPLPSNQRELIEFAEYVREALDSEDPEEREQALNFVRLIEDADEGEEVSIEEAKVLMDQITPEGLSGRLLEPVAESESKETTAVAAVGDLVASTEPLAVDGASIAERRAEKARRRAERSAAGGGGVGAAVGVGAGVGAGSDPAAHAVEPAVEERLENVKTWKNALNFLNRLGFKRKSQKGSHVAFEDRSGATLHVAMPHTDKAETHFAKRFVQKIGSLIKGHK